MYGHFPVRYLSHSQFGYHPWIPQNFAALPEDYAWADAGAKVKVYIDVPLAPEASDDSAPWRNPWPKKWHEIRGLFEGFMAFMDG